MRGLAKTKQELLNCLIKGNCSFTHPLLARKIATNQGVELLAMPKAISKKLLLTNEFRNLLILKEVNILAKTFANAKLGFAIIKGVANFNAIYPHIKYAKFRDVDILVSDINKALKLASDLGYKYDKNYPNDKFTRKFLHHCRLWNTNNKFPFVVELHWKLSEVAPLRLSASHLIERAVWSKSEKFSFPVLKFEDRVINYCIQLSGRNCFRSYVKYLFELSRLIKSQKLDKRDFVKSVKKCNCVDIAYSSIFQLSKYMKGLEPLKRALLPSAKKTSVLKLCAFLSLHFLSTTNYTLLDLFHEISIGGHPFSRMFARLRNSYKKVLNQTEAKNHLKNSNIRTSEEEE